MKKIFLMMFLLSFIISPCYASSDDSSNIPNDKTSVSSDPKELPIILINNSYPDTRRSMRHIKSYLSTLLMEQINKSLTPKFKVTQLDNTYNIVDVSSIEKDDLLKLFKKDNYPILILIEILPVQETGGIIPDDYVTVHLKILNTESETYLYNGKLWSIKSIASRAVREINIQLDKVLQDTLMKQ